MNPIILVVGAFAAVILLWLFFRPPFGKNIIRLDTDQREVERTNKLLQQFNITGQIVFRAPVLTRFLPVAWVLLKSNRTHISCNVWSWDWTTQNADRITKTVLRKTEPGSIIVLHDGKAENKGANRSGTIEATDRIITALKRDEYQFVRLSDVGSIATSN